MARHSWSEQLRSKWVADRAFLAALAAKDADKRKGFHDLALAVRRLGLDAVHKQLRAGRKRKGK